MAIAAAGGGADGDEYRFRPMDGGGDVIAERQTPGRDIIGHQPVQAGFVDRDTARLQHRQLGRIDLDDRHINA